MNRKLLYTQAGETFEIQRNQSGYRIFQVFSENEAKAVSGYYANVGELMNGLAELAIFSGNDAVSLREIKATLQEIRQSLLDYLISYAE